MKKYIAIAIVVLACIFAFGCKKVEEPAPVEEDIIFAEDGVEDIAPTGEVE